ncbi:hypothetical protein PLEOSDRAFT_1066864 [Pleurotus ostreatus PC15]|uniref:Uncharacterized protein n=1 Tax=Pleurotus ostreatus (strain PC15) TaxID=1137138 RepID=A0A067NDD5_PLEO1|nr:hypothetical protein PLEOSDRAFT_1066864 [Pleurotus ostreatus PC15]
MFSAKTTTLVLAYLSWAALSAPVRREVPQEHSHEPFLVSVRSSLNLNNPDGIVDPVFGLLGNAAAANGAGRIADATCLQQATADQAFTNAKAAGDIQGQVDALIFRALERNSGSVGAVTAPCTSITAVNPEIAAISQHQDPASPNAAAVNKAITLELAKQIASVGGDPLDALKAGTFAPGQLNDPTARGNSCNDANDANGCIFTLNLLVPDATPEEIQAAVAGVAAPDAGAGAGAGVDAPAPTAAPVNAGTGAGANTGSGANTGAAANLQKFAGALGGQAAPAVTAGGRGFVVEGSNDFLNVGAALNRSCDIQHNKCANFANSAAGRAAGISVGQCDQQNGQCKSAN